jgi:hydroxymethylpyrimidine kinase/phosphomethylpyrimidine kinase
MENRPPVVLTIAGLDPSGGAGVLADIKTFAAFGCYGLAAVTSLTFQNTQQVLGALNQEAETIQRQLAPLFDDFEISAIKTGMLPTPEIIRGVASVIRDRSVPFLVVDPVLMSTSGFELVDDRVPDTLKNDLFSLASLVTPNLAEAQLLFGAEIRDQIQKERAAQSILETGAGAVLITGGDEESSLATDLLLDEQGFEAFSCERIRSKNTHGTGCTLASAIACLLARGLSLRESVALAKQYVTEAIAAAPEFGHGRGPLNHFPPGFRFEPQAR